MIGLILSVRGFLFSWFIYHRFFTTCTSSSSSVTVLTLTVIFVITTALFLAFNQTAIEANKKGLWSSSYDHH